MKWYRPQLLLIFLAALLQFSAARDPSWTSQRKLAAREQTRALWYHGFNNYMTYAFPLDELTPLSCSGQGPDWNNPRNIASNDVAGNFSLTLVDVLDTFVVLNDRAGFEQAIRNVIEWVSFDVNTKPQVFETTIRVLGGLLSGHIYANQTGQPFYLPWYRDELLVLAYDLGKRLLPAFSTPTGLPYARINLRHGLTRGESTETCTAGAGSLILEFATLSRLTGDERFEKAAYKAFFAIWNRKSDIGLVGNTINTWTGEWTAPEVTGIGAGIDSFYEYALKWYIMSGEVEFLDVWDEAYAAVMRYSRASDGFWYRTVNMKSGDVAYNTIDSLSAFWSGLQVLAGDVQSAVKSHLMYYNLWRTHSGLPEVYDTNFRQATSHNYPLRPEFIESTWYLYRATRDTFYLDVGQRVLYDLVTRAKVNCGLAGIQDLRNNQRDDRMESFALSETLKYLFLLFDEDNPLHKDDSNFVFTTEGHLLTLGQKHLRPLSPARRQMRKIEGHQCPAYHPFVHKHSASQDGNGLVLGIRSRGDAEYARELVALAPNDADVSEWSPSGWCERPRVDLFALDFVLSANGHIVAEDLSPSLLKLGVVPDGFVIQNVTGIRTHIVQRLDGKGYDIRKLGHYTVRPGQVVYINDTALFATPSNTIIEELLNRRDPDVQLRFYDELVDSISNMLGYGELATSELSVTGYTSFFGGDLSVTPQKSQGPLRFSRDGVPVVQDSTNLFGCESYNRSYQDSALLLYRGECTFLQKLLMARAAGAVGAIVINDDDLGINPTASADELVSAGDISDVAMVVITRQMGEQVEEMLIRAGQRGVGRLMLDVDPERRSAVTDARNIPPKTESEEKEGRVLYLNGHPLLNTRLLV